MGITTYLAAACYSLCSVVALLIGLKYLTRSEWMPYHAAASGARWGSFDARMRLTLVTLIQVGGSGPEMR